jgi:hypothetical protein
VRLLLEKAESAFGGKQTAGFQEYITHQDKNGFTPLNSAAYTGQIEIVRLLLKTAESAFGGKQSKEFQAYISQPTNRGFTPIDNCGRLKDPQMIQEMEQLLREYGAEPSKRHHSAQGANSEAFFKRPRGNGMGPDSAFWRRPSTSGSSSRLNKTSTGPCTPPPGFGSGNSR